MDVVIGAIPATAAAGRRLADASAPLEAKVLHVRAPRRTRDQLKATLERRRALLNEKPHAQVGLSKND